MSNDVVSIKPRLGRPRKGGKALNIDSMSSAYLNVQTSSAEQSKKKAVKMLVTYQARHNKNNKL